MQESHGVVTFMEMWWDDSHDWGAAVGGYKLLRSYRDEKGGVVQYIRECSGCIAVKASDAKVEKRQG